ncbi:hypothetical protein [Paraburkholderia sp. 32]|uniref:hypothetical protein n=1 Tax=Paraburkholderia sp. 32 TaxID=2991057 RepID=UPI003D263B15
MEYIYRYDPLHEHIKMHGDMLRARRWSLAAGSWAHKPLIEAEKTVPPGESIFRICFWKSLDAAKLNMGHHLWPSMHVVQRVRADHQFFNTFCRIDDDFLKDSAWLFWRQSKRNADQIWTHDGIPKEDIDVFDIDGNWRKASNAVLLSDSQAKFCSRGYFPHYFINFSGAPEVVFWTTRLMKQEDGERVAAILIVHPETHIHVYAYPHVAQEIIGRALSKGIGSYKADRIKCFAVSQDRETFNERDLLEIPIVGRWSRIDQRPKGFLERFRKTPMPKPVYTISLADSNDWCWHPADSSIAIRVMRVFQWKTLKQTIACYASMIDAL